MATTSDGMNWSDPAYIVTDFGADCRFLLTKERTFIAVADRSTGSMANPTASRLFSSKDGVNWTFLKDLDFRIISIIQGIDGQFYAASEDKIFNSRDGKGWNECGVFGWSGQILTQGRTGTYFLIGKHSKVVGDAIYFPDVAVSVSDDAMQWSKPNVILHQNRRTNGISMCCNSENELLVLFGTGSLNLLMIPVSNLTRQPYKEPGWAFSSLLPAGICISVSALAILWLIALIFLIYWKPKRRLPAPARVESIKKPPEGPGLP